MKFKEGDELIPIISGRGFENSIVLKIVEENGKQYYLLKIVNGTATIPISAEENYILKGTKIEDE